MTNTIYTQHDAAFRNVSAYIIMKGGERVATVAFKFPRDGAGRLYCYLHVSGLPMVRGYAGGYGYDKKSAAFTDAAHKQRSVKLESWQTADGYKEQRAISETFYSAVAGRDGYDWDHNLRKAGFTVLQAV
jgi:hypothetical protein